MTVILHEVPGHVQHVDHIRNHVQVKGGKNWDFSRSALQTPIEQIQDPEPKKVPVQDVSEPLAAPSVVRVSFARNSAVVGQTGVRLLSELPSDALVTVVGHADRGEKAPADLAKRRAEAVAKRLQGKVKGVRVEVTRQFGAPAAAHRMVEVRIDPAYEVELILPADEPVKP